MDLVSHHIRNTNVDGKLYHVSYFHTTCNQTMKEATEKKLLQAANLSPSEEWIERIVEVHPMKQVAVMSVVQIVVLMGMGVCMYIIGRIF